MAGFTEAQRELREKLGRDVVFTLSIDRTYPPDTALDESGEALDPTITPDSTVINTRSIKASVVRKPLDRASLAQLAVGITDELDEALIVDITELATVHDAINYERSGQRYKIVAVRSDGIGADQRVVILAKLEGDV